MNEKKDIFMYVTIGILCGLLLCSGAVIVRQYVSISRYRTKLAECEKSLGEVEAKSEWYKRQCGDLTKRLVDAREVVERDRGEVATIRELCDQSLDIIGEIIAVLWPVEGSGTDSNSDSGPVNGDVHNDDTDTVNGGRKQ